MSRVPTVERLGSPPAREALPPVAPIATATSTVWDRTLVAVLAVAVGLTEPPVASRSITRRDGVTEVGGRRLNRRLTRTRHLRREIRQDSPP
jgi:hypothetical protein